MAKLLTVVLLVISFGVFVYACRKFPDYQSLLTIIAIATALGCKPCCGQEKTGGTSQ